MVYQASIKSCLPRMTVFPAILAAISAVLIVARLFLLFRSKKKQWERPRIVFQVFGFFILASVLFISASRLSRGIYLPFEDESQLLSASGTVTAIEPDRSSPRFSLEGQDGVSYGCVITLEGKQYYCLKRDAVRPGDEVIVQYLPKSKIILRCERRGRDGT